MKLFVITEPSFKIFNATIQWNSLIMKVNKTCDIKIAHKTNEVSWEIDVNQKS